MTTKTRPNIRALLHGCRGKIGFGLSVRCVDCSVSQDAGKIRERLEITFGATTHTVWFKELVERAEVRVVSFDGPYDQHPNGELVHGYMRVENKQLEIAIGVPSPSFATLSAVCTDGTDGALTLIVSPFESDEIWNGRDNLLLREVHFQYEPHKVSHADIRGQIPWVPTV